MKLCAKNEEDLKVVDVEGKGKGVVPTRPFRRGELICEYSGDLVSEKEAKSREEEYTKAPSIGCYMYYFSNLVTKVIEVDNRPYLCLLASRDVKVGEELLYDYGERRRGVVQSLPWLAS